MQKGSCKRFDGLSFCRRSDEANGETSPDQATAIPEAMSAGSVGTNSILSSLSSEKIKSSWHNEHLCCNQCQTNFLRGMTRVQNLKKNLYKMKVLRKTLRQTLKRTTATYAYACAWDESQLGGRDGGWDGRHDGTDG